MRKYNLCFACLFLPSFVTVLTEQDFEGLLNNLQDWELSFKDKDKKLKSQSMGKEKMVIFITFLCFRCTVTYARISGIDLYYA